MIYKYDDIVKTIKGKFMFSELGGQDVGKIITVDGLNGPENCFGGRIDEVCENTIIYMREFIEDGRRKRTASCITAEGIGGAPDCKICIYEPMTGDHTVYRSEEFVHSMKSKIEFNTDILRPGARFFAENPHGTSIFEVLGCGRYILRIKECSLLEGIKFFSTMDDAYDVEELKSFTFKTMDELKPYDLFRKGFSGYKLSIDAICKIKEILDKEEIIVDD